MIWFCLLRVSKPPVATYYPRTAVPNLYSLKAPVQPVYIPQPIVQNDNNPVAPESNVQSQYKQQESPVYNVNQRKDEFYDYDNSYEDYGSENYYDGGDYNAIKDDYSLEYENNDYKPEGHDYSNSDDYYYYEDDNYGQKIIMSNTKTGEFILSLALSLSLSLSLYFFGVFFV